LEERKAQRKERPKSKLIRIGADSYSGEQRFNFASALAEARRLQEPSLIAEEIAYRVGLPFEIERIILNLPQAATIEDAAEAATRWRGGLVAAVRRQLHTESDSERLLLVATALEWTKSAYIEFYKKLGWSGDAQDALEAALSRFGSFITRKHIAYVVPGRFSLSGGDNDGPTDVLLLASHSAVAEGITSELSSQPEWLAQLALALPEVGKRADLAVLLLSLGAGRRSGPSQDAITAVLFDAKGLTSRFVAKFAMVWPACGTIFKERLFKYLDADPTRIVRQLAAWLALVEPPSEDAWRLLRLLLKERYLLAGGQPLIEVYGSHAWGYLVKHIGTIPEALRLSLDELADKDPALFTYALGEVLVRVWSETPASFREAFLSKAALVNEKVQEKVLREIAQRWATIPQELRDLFLRQSCHPEYPVRVAVASAAWIYWEDNPAVFDPIFMKAVDDPDIRVPLNVLPSSGKYEQDRQFSEALLRRVDGATAAAMLERFLEYGAELESTWRLEVVRKCIEKGGDLARGVLAERHFSANPPKPVPYFSPPDPIFLEPEAVQLGAIHAYAECSGNWILSEEEVITLVEGLSRPYRDWALAYLSIQLLHLPQKVHTYIEGLEDAEDEDGHAVREGKKHRNPRSPRVLWRFPVLWLSEALREATPTKASKL
jgi:hypothetical protein